MNFEMNMEYTAVIRTLGTAGEKYQRLLDSLKAQTVAPHAILVYIAEGYPLPKETVGTERYIYVKKGMVAQRALPYDEVETEWILFLDDDLLLAQDTVERMYTLLKENQADVISPDIFPNAKRPFAAELMMTLSGRMRARRSNSKWGYKVMRTAGYSYNKKVRQGVRWSETNAGACFMCRKSDFLSIRFREELWLDTVTYSLGEDQVMYYKMFLHGLRILTWYDHQVQHLDGGGNLSPEKERMLIYCDFWFKTIFWHRFIFMPERNLLLKLWSCVCIVYVLLFTFGISFLKGHRRILKLKKKALDEARIFLKSVPYQKLSTLKR